MATKLVEVRITVFDDGLSESETEEVLEGVEDIDFASLIRSKLRSPLDTRVRITTTES